MKSRRRKMIAPLVVSAIVILYYAAYFGILMALIEGSWKLILGVVLLALSAAMIKVCKERIEEIREGEEDDIGKY